MKAKTNKIIVYILVGLLLLFCFLYLICQYKWAGIPFGLTLVIVSMYNLFFNRPK